MNYLKCLPVYILIFALLCVISVAAIAQDLSVLTILEPQDEQLAEGKAYDIKWTSTGIQSISITANGDYTEYPGQGRGRFNIVIAEAVPAGQGGVSWAVPFLDTVQFKISIKGYDSYGQQIAAQEAVYLFRPDVLRTRTADGIYIDVRDESRQRMYVLRDNRVIRAYLTSGAFSNQFYPRNVHPKKPHDHPGVYKVIAKYPNWYSRLFRVNMPWAMRYLNGHFIHATSPPYYQYLGTAASNGCNRLQYDQAKELYDMTPVGTRVEIIAH